MDSAMNPSVFTRVVGWRVWLMAVSVAALGAAGGSARAAVPSPEVAAAVITATGLSPECAAVLVSDIDPAWAVADDYRCGGAQNVVVTLTPTAWVVAARVNKNPLPDCPIVGVPSEIGFELQTCRITRPLAEQITDGYLAGRYAQWWPTAPRRWLKCPTQEIIENTDGGLGPFAICRFEMSRSDTADVLAGELTIDATVIGRIGAFSARAYTKSLRGCRIPSIRRDGKVTLTARRLSASGYFARCATLVSDAGMARDLEVRARLRYPKPLRAVEIVALHGTNQAGFDDARFRCTVRRVGARTTATCRNPLGDWFRHSFRITATASPRVAPVRLVSPPRVSPPQSGGIPLQPDLPGDQDCSDMSGPVRVLPGDPDRLDRDGDGIGCE